MQKEQHGVVFCAHGLPGSLLEGMQKRPQSIASADLGLPGSLLEGMQKRFLAPAPEGGRFARLIVGRDAKAMISGRAIKRGLPGSLLEGMQKSPCLPL